MNQLELIQSKIYEIRGQKVMLDFDLAEMYGTETAQLKRAVRRNIERFEGEDFMFEVTREELSRYQIGTLNKGRGSNIKYLPFAFTELGVAMRKILAASPSNEIVKLQSKIKELQDYMEEVFSDQNDINEDTRAQLELINQTLAELQAQKRQQDKPRNPVGFIKPKE